MKRVHLGIALAAMLLAAFAAGCCHRPQDVVCAPNPDRRIVASILDEQAVAAVQRQRAIYSWHFAPGTADLNELGRRDLAIIAAQDKTRPGTLHVRLGSDDMREARLAAIRACLESQGVEVARMNFDEDWPGGDGVGGEAAARSVTPDAAGPMPMLMAPMPPASGSSGSSNRY